MTPLATQLEELYARLGQALENPQSVGLQNRTLPQPLADLLRSAQSTLGQILADIRDECSTNTLEAELSQDADR